ncbi:MAG TPA: FecR domain-containing protein [Candidatus Methylomirabilis sp.]|nr:FecR domain-containing protein [Candidatus Methylomirabilis sp.]
MTVGYLGRVGKSLIGRTTRTTVIAAVCSLLMTVLLGASEGATPSVGIVKMAEGTAVVQRGDQTLAASAGLALQEGDVLRTGADGRLGVVLRDDTRVSLGPETEIRIDRFLFAPAQGQLALVLKMARGVAAYVSGKIAKLSPDAVHVETPVAIVGVRGTHFVAKVESP